MTKDELNRRRNVIRTADNKREKVGTLMEYPVYEDVEAIKRNSLKTTEQVIGKLGTFNDIGKKTTR